jgi:predicted molibdopterin-dependent oxidoreductase YjgC
MLHVLPCGFTQAGEPTALWQWNDQLHIQAGLYDKEFVENWTYGFEELKERVKPYTPEKSSADYLVRKKR